MLFGESVSRLFLIYARRHKTRLVIWSASMVRICSLGYAACARFFVSWGIWYFFRGQKCITIETLHFCSSQITHLYRYCFVQLTWQGIAEVHEFRLAAEVTEHWFAYWMKRRKVDQWYWHRQTFAQIEAIHLVWCLCYAVYQTAFWYYCTSHTVRSFSYLQTKRSCDLSIKRCTSSLGLSFDGKCFGS